MKQLFLLLAMLGLIFVSCESDGVKEPTNDNPTEQPGGDESTPDGEKIATIEEQMAAIEQSLPRLRSIVEHAEALVSEPEATTRGNDNGNNGVKTLIAELEERIAALEEYIRSGGAGEWTDATYATLDMYEETIALIAALQTEVEALKGQDEALREEVLEAIEQSIESMKSWVNELLTGYYDIAAIDAMFASLLEGLTSADTDIRGEIESIRATLAEQLATMEEAYKEAIKSAIEENNGLLDEKLTKAINDVNARIDEEVAKINQRLDDIEERLSKLEGSVSDLLKRIQSIAYVPIHEDGSARVTFPNNDTSSSTLQLDFMISPKDAAEDLAKVYAEAVSVQVLYTGSPIMTDLPIISCDAVATQGLFSVTCACDDISWEFYNGDVTARAIMYISDGNNDRTSEYITIVPNRTQIQNNQIWYTVSNKLPIEIEQGYGPRIILTSTTPLQDTMSQLSSRMFILFCQSISMVVASLQVSHFPTAQVASSRRHSPTAITSRLSRLAVHSAISARELLSIAVLAPLLFPQHFGTLLPMLSYTLIYLILRVSKSPMMVLA